MSQRIKRRLITGSLFRAANGLVGVLLAGLLLWSEPMTAASTGSQGAAQSEQETRLLEPGKPIERELAGGQSHSYHLTLAAAQFLHVVVEQRGIDVAVILFGPDGKKLAEVDSPNGTQGPEPLKLVTEAAGSYRVEVRSLEKEAAPGRYQVRIEELRAATAQDRSRVAAENDAKRLSAEGEQLRARGDAEALRGAIAKYEEALPLWRVVGDRQGEAETLNNMGYVYSLLSESQKALDYYGQALPLWRIVGDRQGEAYTLNNIGVVYDSLGENQKALDYYNQSLPLRRAVGDRRGEANTLSNIGKVYSNLSENQKALDYYSQALPLRQAAGDRYGVAVTLHNMGEAYNSLSELQKALDSFNQALHLFRAVGDRRGEAYSLTGLVVIYQSLGEMQKALEAYSQALPLLRAVGDRYGEAYTLSNIGGFYAEMGEKQKALDYHGQALQLRRATGDRAGEAYTLNYIGAVYSDLGEKQKSLDSFNQALQLFRAVGDRRGEAHTLTALGLVYSDLGENQKALDYYNQALPLHRDVGYRQGEAYTLHNIGWAYDLLGKPQQAIDYYNQALLLHRAVGERSSEAATLSNIARIERNRGNLSEARTQTEAVLRIVESLRAKIASPQLRASYFASEQMRYGFYIDLLMRLRQQSPSAGYEAAALQASERARARSLLEILAEARADIRQGVDPTLLERERSSRHLLNAKAERQVRLLSGKHTEEQAAAIAKDIDALSTEYQEIQAQIRATSPRYAALTQPQPLSLEEIQRQVLDAKTLLLEYALGEERSYLWLVSPNSITSFELPARSVVEDAARRVYDLLTARARKIPDETAAQRRARITQSDKDYPAAAAALSRMVVGPAAAQLGKKRLVVAPDGALQYIPFAILPKPVKASVASGPPLMLEHEIVSLPSASTLAVMRRELAGRHPAPKIAAVLADPVFELTDPRIKTVAGAEQKPTGDQNNRQDTTFKETFVARTLDDTGVVNPGQSIPRLPYSQREAATIRSLVPNGLRRLALDFEASYATATSPELSNYRIVHFATHGLLNSKQPELSGILLSLVDEQGRPQENGLLRLGEIFNLKLPAELVVLSACQTALGKEVKGEGLVGMTRGFMYAGAPRVVASLWKVDDRATAELMKLFYEGMLGKRRLRPAEALRQAQIAMWRQSEWRSPIYWGAFTFQGEWK